jgi:hypothetical protein
MANIKRDKSVAAKLPVMMRDSSGNPVTGLADTDVVVKYQKQNGSLTTKTMSPSNWTEVGQGKYDISFTATELNTEGDFFYPVTGTGAEQFSGLARIELNRNLFKTDEFRTLTYNGLGQVETVTIKLGDKVTPKETWKYTFTYDGDGNVSTVDVEKQ